MPNLTQNNQTRHKVNKTLHVITKRNKTKNMSMKLECKSLTMLNDVFTKCNMKQEFNGFCRK